MFRSEFAPAVRHHRERRAVVPANRLGVLDAGVRQGRIRRRCVGQDGAARRDVGQ